MAGYQSYPFNQSVQSEANRRVRHLIAVREFLERAGRDDQPLYELPILILEVREPWRYFSRGHRAKVRKQNENQI